MYTNVEISQVECQGYQDFFQFYPTWIGGLCNKNGFGESQIPMIFVATLLVLLMCGAVYFAVVYLKRDKKSLKEWALRDRVTRKIGVPSVEFTRMSNNNTFNFNPFGVMGYDVSPLPVNPSDQSSSQPPSFLVAVPPPPSYVDCVVSANGVNSV